MMSPFSYTLLYLSISWCLPERTEGSALLSQPNSTGILSSTIQAMGGVAAFNIITSISLDSSTIYRSQTLTQNYHLHQTDQSVAEAGTQRLVFQAHDDHLQERIERQYRYGEYWTWAFPQLHPVMNFTAVVQDGENGFAYFRSGQNSFYSEEPDVALGYADSALTDYLVHEAYQYALPFLLKQFVADLSTLRLTTTKDEISGTVYPTLFQERLGLRLLMNATNHLPHAVRSYETHEIFGPSTSDLVFSNYSTVPVPNSNVSIVLPHRFMTVYNDLNIIEDFLLDNITINPPLTSGYFSPTPHPDTTTIGQPAAPSEDPTHPRSEVHEFFESGLWTGPLSDTYNGTNIRVEYPIPGLNAVKSIWVDYAGYADYVQLLVEFDDELLITDAPPHRSRVILQWIAETMPGKHVAYVVPTHHHRDHAGGVGDYVNAGAALVVPQVAREYYSKVNSGDVRFVTYDESQPFVKRGDLVQFKSYWRGDNPHAEDWSYALVSKACPGEDDTTAVYNADVVSPTEYETDGQCWETQYARQWLVDAISDGVPRSATVIGTHGSTVNNDGVSNAYALQRVAQVVGLGYPDISPVELCH